MKTLAEIIAMLDRPGRFLSTHFDATTDFFYILREVDQSGDETDIEAFYITPEARAALERCGNCAEFSESSSDGLAYGPYCSTYSLARNIAENQRRIS